MITKFFPLFVAAIILLNPMISFAAENNAPAIPVDIGALGPAVVPAVPNKKVIEATYTQMTYDNLYKLAWSYDAFSPSNEEALNTYLIITECNLYNKFFQNEFEWEKIKTATKQYIEANKTKVARYYEYVQPIFMGRYDYSLQGFPIVDAKEFKGQRNFQFASFISGDTTCGHFNINNITYPSTGVVTINSPLNLTFIRVPLSLAEKYIDWRSKQGVADEGKRQAYIRYRIRIDGYDGTKAYADLNAFNFSGKLMRLDVFADKELMLPLYNQVF